MAARLAMRRLAPSVGERQTKTRHVARGLVVTSRRELPVGDFWVVPTGESPYISADPGGPRCLIGSGTGNRTPRHIGARSSSLVSGAYLVPEQNW
jgi:hypothetical protein